MILVKIEMNFITLLIICFLVVNNCYAQDNNMQEKYPIKNKGNYNKLTEKEKNIIDRKGTEYQFSGGYIEFKKKGTYLCKKCNSPLYKSEDKFDSHCGWPSFDGEIENAVKKTLDADGRRTEITCNNCRGHLGHVFLGEEYTKKNIRHCVNSLSLLFVPSKEL